MNKFEIIKKCIDKYDYFSLLAGGAPKDEFDSYSSALANSITENDSIEDIAQKIAKTMDPAFGEEINSLKFIDLARQINEHLYEAAEKQERQFEITAKRRNAVSFKYIKIFMKRNAYLSLFCAAICAVPLFIVALCYDAVPNDILIALTPFVLCAVVIVISFICTIRFRAEISEQEKKYHVTLSDAGEIMLDSTVFLTDEWLIFAGRHAFYKPEIISIKGEIVNAHSPSRKCRMTIAASNGKTARVSIYSPSADKKIHSWKAK